MTKRPTRRYWVHTAEEIDGIRRAAAATACVRDRLSETVHPGMSTLAVDQLAGTLIAQTGGTSAFHGYHGFPGQVCISVNDEVVHGIGRGHHVIQPGDLVSLDVGVKLDGYLGDTALTICAGEAMGPLARDLIAATQEALAAGIAAARGTNHVSAIGEAVERVVIGRGFSVVRDFVGHGCGCELHEPPEVPNFAPAAKGVKLRPGMVLAIEPMVNSGSYGVTVDADGWTVRTADHGLSAHFEHMVLVTNEEPEILTWRKKA